MASEWNGGVVVFTCDTCTEIRETEEREFIPALSEVKQAGWEAYQAYGIWCHRCPNCSERPS